jgi:hypothetical protein
MAALTFDTLKFVERLKAAGVPEAQAKAEAEALAEALSSGTTELATRRDMELVRQDMREHELRIETRFETIKGELTLIKWMMGLIVVAEAVPFLAKLFH